VQKPSVFARMTSTAREIARKTADDVYGLHGGANNNWSDTEQSAARLTSVKAALTFLQSFVGARQHTVVATTQHAAAVNQTYL
jgi:hypothetical protein